MRRKTAFRFAPHLPAGGFPARFLSGCLIACMCVIFASCAGVNPGPGGSAVPEATELPDDYYTFAEVDVNMERYFIFRIWNFSKRTKKDFRSTVDTAIASGFNAIKIHMPWHRIESADGEADFTELDSMLDYVVSEKGVKAAVSIDFARKYGDGMLTDDEIQRDIDGNLCVGDIYYNRAVLSFCSESATGKAVSFYKKAVEHVNSRYGDGILLYLPAFTPYCETEYWCTAGYDYSDAAVDSFRKELAGKYGTVEKLNAAAGTAFSSFDKVVPPLCTDTDAYGVLWYNFRHEALKMFIDRLIFAQKEAAPDSKAAIQLGSVFDNMSTLRATLRFADLCENADVLWVDDGPVYNHRFSMDYVRTVLAGKTEISQEIDGPLQVSASPEAYLDQGEVSFARGAKYVSIANWSIDSNYRKYEHVWEKIAGDWLGDEKPPVVSLKMTDPPMTVSLYNRFMQGNWEALLSEYDRLQQETGAVRIIVLDDMEAHEP